MLEENVYPSNVGLNISYLSTSWSLDIVFKYPIPYTLSFQLFYWSVTERGTSVHLSLRFWEFLLQIFWIPGRSIVRLKIDTVRSFARFNTDLNQDISGTVQWREFMREGCFEQPGISRGNLINENTWSGLFSLIPALSCTMEEFCEKCQ